MGDFTVQFGRLVAYRGKDTKVVIPDNVKVIGRRAFYKSKVTAVILPDSVTEIEQEAFLYANLEHIELGHGIKKIGANAFLCGTNIAKSIYPHVPISVFAKTDQSHAFHHFVHVASQADYDPDVFECNLSFVRKNLLREIGYKTVCIDVLAKNYELLVKVLESGKIPRKDLDLLIARFTDENNADMLALLLQYQSKSKVNDYKL